MTSPHDNQSHYSHHPAVESMLPRQEYRSTPAYQPQPTLNHITTGHASAPHDPTQNAQNRNPSLDEPASQGLDESGYSQRVKPATTARPVTRFTLPPINMNLPLEERGAEVLRLAVEAFAQSDNWVIFYREILGVEGVARKLFKTTEELAAWESTPQFEEVHTMLCALRSHDTGKGDTFEAQRMITVRLPASLHEVLKRESDEQGLSINKLCITKLLHRMDPRFVPQEPGKRRGRKPGPQGKRSAKIISIEHQIGK